MDGYVFGPPNYNCMYRRTSRANQSLFSTTLSRDRFDGIKLVFSHLQGPSVHCFATTRNPLVYPRWSRRPQSHPSDPFCVGGPGSCRSSALEALRWMCLRCTSAYS